MDKKIVLLVEDNAQEAVKATKILRERGFKIMVATNLTDAMAYLKMLEGKLSGIVTDLHFPQMGFEHPKDSADKPSGFAVIIQAILANVPVVVCSNIDHHFADYAQVVIKGLEKMGGQPIPFIMDSKDWQRAAEKLINILPNKEVKE